jgi:hypothetical protein
MSKTVIVLVVIAAGAAVVSARSAPDVKRYMKMRSM